MGFDIRFPIGLLFVVIGSILAIYGVAGDQSVYVRSLGINVNFWWGLVMMVFGIVFLLFTRSSSKRSGLE